MRKLYHLINKPFAKGFCVLENSKLNCMLFIYLCFDVNKIKTVIFLYKYKSYALLKNSFGERVRMLYIDTNSFFLHFFVEDLAKEINARPYVRDAFDFSEISNGHLSNLERSHADVHAGLEVYLKNKSKGNLIIEFFGRRPNLYLFIVCDASEPIPGVN